MKKLINSNINIKDILLASFVFFSFVLVCISLSYYDFTSPVQAIIWITWFVFSVISLFFSSRGEVFYQFAKSAKIEIQKVVWPTRQETIQTTSIVMAMVAVTGFVLWGVDSVIIWIIAKLTHLG